MRSSPGQLNLLPFSLSIHVVKIELLQCVTEVELSFSVFHSSPWGDRFSIFWSSFTVQPFLFQLCLTIRFKGLGPSLHFMDVKKSIATDSKGIPICPVLSYYLPQCKLYTIVQKEKNERLYLIFSFNFRLVPLSWFIPRRGRCVPDLLRLTNLHFKWDVSVCYSCKMGFQSRERRECPKLFSSLRAVQVELCTIRGSTGKFTCICPYHHLSNLDMGLTGSSLWTCLGLLWCVGYFAEGTWKSFIYLFVYLFVFKEEA